MSPVIKELKCEYKMVKYGMLSNGTWFFYNSTIYILSVVNEKRCAINISTGKVENLSNNIDTDERDVWVYPVEVEVKYRRVFREE